MSPFAEALKRLYTLGRVSAEKIEQLRKESKITQSEYDFIFNK